MQSSEIYSIFVEVAFTVLNLSLILTWRFYSCFVEPDQQISYIKFSLSWLYKQNLAHCV